MALQKTVGKFAGIAAAQILLVLNHALMMFVLVVLPLQAIVTGSVNMPARYGGSVYISGPWARVLGAALLLVYTGILWLIFRDAKAKRSTKSAVVSLLVSAFLVFLIIMGNMSPD